jgi:nitrogen fixation protein NifZ
MPDIARDSDSIEIDGPPAFEHGERVVSRYTVRNDGTFPGREVGELLVSKGDIGIVTSVGTFLQQFYIYSVEFIEHGYRVGMKGREIVSLDRLPPHVIEALGPERVAQVAQMRGAAVQPAPEAPHA